MKVVLFLILALQGHPIAPPSSKPEPSIEACTKELAEVMTKYATQFPTVQSEKPGLQVEIGCHVEALPGDPS